MEVRIGVQQTQREIALESAQSQEDVVASVRAALADGGILALEDEKGRQILVPAERIAYVEISPATGRRVGFGS